MKPLLFPASQAVVLALFACFTCTVRAEGPPAPPAASEDVLLTGWLHVDAYDFNQARVQVEVDGEVRSAHVSKSGRFEIALPAGTEAVLRFEHPGHLTKEVLVDTRYALDGQTGKHPRRLRFAVVLEQERYMSDFGYAGPVGNIGFEKEGGCMAIAHTRTLVPGQRRPMVF